MIKNEITIKLVQNLIAEQFLQWASLPIKPVAFSGWDNRMFRLGDSMVVRLPSAERYADKVQKEQEWLPFLAKNLSTKIPNPVAMGVPSEHYPWNWSIYEWLPGTSANQIEFSDAELEKLALDLAKFINELHRIDTTDAPQAGAHNFYRGGDLAVYDIETRESAEKLKDKIDYDAAIAIWQQALNSTLNQKPVWVHGDLAVGNILVDQNHRLSAIIDFGGMAVGDPACDLVMAWNLFKGKSRRIFTDHVALGFDTWSRAKGWALWKALITAVDSGDIENNLDIILSS